MHKYFKKINIPFYDSDIDGYVRPINILKYFGETTSEETDKLIDENEVDFSFGWMLYRWKVEIIEYPKAKDDVQVNTWISKLDRFYAFREFTLTDEIGRTMVKASTVWLCIDMSKKRPIRIPKEYSEVMEEVGEANFKNFSDFKDLPEIDSYSDFKVRRSDIDSNNHVNNAKYLSWIVESMTEDIYNDYRLSEFEIIYKKEIKYGDVISTGFALDSRESGFLEFNHIITDFHKQKEHAFGKTKWIKKD